MEEKEVKALQNDIIQKKKFVGPVKGMDDKIPFMDNDEVRTL